MDGEQVQARRDEVITAHGPWVGWNIRLADGVTTMGHDQVGTAEMMVQTVVQNVGDLAGKPLADLRVLDLGCHEGGYAIELGLHGATVVGVEGRRANVEKARFAAEALGLDRVSFIEGDVRELPDDLGRFDVVLCLGILYHLEARDAVRLAARCYDLCERLTVIRSAIGLSGSESTTVDGYVYRGRRYVEDTSQRGASLDNASSILPTRMSLLNLMADIGFTSVAEVRNPAVPRLDDLVDSLMLVAMRGERVAYRSFPDLDPVMTSLRHHDGGTLAFLRKAAHPQQGIYWKARERLLHTIERTVFQSRRPIREWQADSAPRR